MTEAAPVEEQPVASSETVEEPVRETDRSKDVKIFDDSQEIEPQITRKSVPENPLQKQQS